MRQRADQRINIYRSNSMIGWIFHWIIYSPGRRTDPKT